MLLSHETRRNILLRYFSVFFVEAESKNHKEVVETKVTVSPVFILCGNGVLFLNDSISAGNDRVAFLTTLKSMDGSSASSGNFSICTPPAIVCMPGNNDFAIR